MFDISRTSGVSIPQQIVDAVRLNIVTGDYPVGHQLPASRALADELGVSFHSVQKAYRQLEKDGLIVRNGRSFFVTSVARLDENDRMEEGASIVKNALTRLMSLGFKSEEIDYLVEEQRTLIIGRSRNLKCVLVADSDELSYEAKKQVESTIRRTVELATLDSLWRHTDADFVFAPHHLLRRVSREFQQAVVVGATMFPSPVAMAAIGLMHDHETLGVVTYDPATLPWLTKMLKSETAYSGQIMATSLADGSSHLDQFVSSVDVIIFTEAAKRRLRPHLGAKRNEMVSWIIAESSLHLINQSLPSD